ncbi:MAG: LysR family transcriptional regulator [Acidihalobacter sp.]
MKPKLPPLNALRAFEATARLGSVTRAAEELCVTHAAVSRQVKQLESNLGIGLFTRTGRGLTPTPAGEQLLAAASEAFDLIRASTQRIKQPPSNEALTLSCEPTLAMRWLIPRLSTLQTEVPKLSLKLVTAGGPVAWREHGIDLAIRRNDFAWGPGVSAWHLADEYVGPVGAPSLQTPFEANTDRLRGVDLLHTRSRPEAWARWSAASGTSLHGSRDIWLEHFHLIIQAAIAGLGWAIASHFMVGSELTTGVLQAPQGFVADGSAYFLLGTETLEADPRKQRTLEWLRAELQADSTRRA